MDRYQITFDFDGGTYDEGGNFISEPPHVFVSDEYGVPQIEVFEDADPTVEFPNCDPEHWEAGPIAKALLDVMNQYMPTSS